MPTRLPALAPLSPAQIRNASNLYSIASDQTRLKIMSLLTDGEAHVTAICDHVGLVQPAVSHHLQILRAGHLAEARREGKHNFYSLTANGRKLVKLAAGLGE